MKWKFSSHARVKYVTVEMIRGHVTDNIQGQEHVWRLYIQRRALCWGSFDFQSQWPPNNIAKSNDGVYSKPKHESIEGLVKELIAESKKWKSTMQHRSWQSWGEITSERQWLVDRCIVLYCFNWSFTSCDAWHTFFTGTDVHSQWWCMTEWIFGPNCS